jgi:hypothetical protein
MAESDPMPNRSEESPFSKPVQPGQEPGELAFLAQELASKAERPVAQRRHVDSDQTLSLTQRWMPSRKGARGGHSQLRPEILLGPNLSLKLDQVQRTSQKLANSLNEVPWRTRC